MLHNEWQIFYPFRNMNESFKSSFRMMLITLWRRKIFLFSLGIIWVVVYLYIHYSTEADEKSSFSDATSVKQPIEIDVDSSKEKLISFKPQRIGDYKITTLRMNEMLNNPVIQRIPESHYIGMTEEEIRQHRLNEELEIKKHSQKSVREKYMEKGVKPNSIVVKPKYKTQDQYSETLNPSSTEWVKGSHYVPYVPPLRIVHFDLKGAPPKITYFKSIFPIIRSAGANGILLEYEDTFPFWGPLSSIAAKNAYTKKQIRYILEFAKTNDLIVIPLVQTFGHLEFVLKLSEFKHLREVEDIPQSLCPTNNGSLNMIKIMISQIMSLHTDSKWLHIGSDEVYQLGHCSRCSRYDKNSLFLAYVRKVANYVREQHKVIPIMWDDMLRHFSVSELEKYNIGKLIEPMAWTYVEDVYSFLPNSLWEKYSQVFPYIWTASAFKGAFGETLTVPDAKRHLENNKAWLSVMREQNSSFSGFRGITLTGWQRYDHFASLCELLPAGLPSLMLDLITVTQGEFTKDVFPKVQELLECSSRIHYHLDLEHDPHLWRALGVCFFPGSAVFRLTVRHDDVVKSLDKYINDITAHKGWMTEYNVNHDFSSPLRVNELLKDFGYYNSSLQMLQEAAIKALREVYEDDTVAEWIELNIYPYTKKMKAIWEQGKRLKKYQIWPRRPLPRVVNLPPPPNINLSFVTS